MFILCGVFISLLAGCTQSNPASSNPENSPTATSESAAPTGDTNDLKAGGSSYLDPQGTFSVLYPNDYTLDTQDAAHPRIYKRGETQRPQSEMSDGVIVVFETINLEGKSLEDEVDSRIKAATLDGTSEIIQPKKAITLNAYPGYQYEIRGLGSSTNVFVEKSSESKTAVLITYMVSDPTQKGYQDDVQVILSTLNLLK